MPDNDVGRFTGAELPAVESEVGPAARRSSVDDVGAVEDLSELQGGGRSQGGGRDPASKLAVQLTAEQRRWVDDEAARRGLPKSAIMRDLVASAIGGPADIVVPSSVPAGSGASARAPGFPESEDRPGGPAAGGFPASDESRVGSDPGVDRGRPEYSQLPPGVRSFEPGSPVQPASADVPAEVIDDGRAARALALSPGTVRGPETGFFVMIPGVGMVRASPAEPAMPSAPYANPANPATAGGGSWALPRWMRVCLTGLCVAAVLLAFGFLASSIVANRYYFAQVETAPGRAVFYKVDRWTGEMVRCRTDIGAVGEVC